LVNRTAVSGLLSYNARYYDPGIGRFISADTIVPGNASGGMEGVQVKPLTVGFHETQFLGKLNGENKAGFWFQLSDEEQEQAGSPWGPANPQALNRYSYVRNNPLRYTDPTGHVECAAGPCMEGGGGGGGGGSCPWCPKGGPGVRGSSPGPKGSRANGGGGGKRTSHAKDRQAEGRPVEQAMPDAQRARQADVYVQPNGRYVVRGPNGREHIFEPNGQVLTSVRRPDSAHSNKVVNGERRSVTEAEYRQFKELVR